MPNGKYAQGCHIGINHIRASCLITGRIRGINGPGGGGTPCGHPCSCIKALVYDNRCLSNVYVTQDHLSIMNTCIIYIQYTYNNIRTYIIFEYAHSIRATIYIRLYRDWRDGTGLEGLEGWNGTGGMERDWRDWRDGTGYLSITGGSS